MSNKGLQALRVNRLNTSDSGFTRLFADLLSWEDE